MNERQRLERLLDACNCDICQAMRKTCPQCGGDGWGRREFQLARKTDPHAILDGCTHCSGTGKVLVLGIEDAPLIVGPEPEAVTDFDPDYRRMAQEAWDKAVSATVIKLFADFLNALPEPERWNLVEDLLHSLPINPTTSSMPPLLTDTARELNRLTSSQLLSTTDCEIWDREFCKRNPEVDEGTMVAWFASAMCAKMDAMNRDRQGKGSENGP